ncbi:CAT RNA binding domain-containing protein [Clostridioides difficile]|nr:CAT RNA binding domain-containing protein [Clostridioides difficile]
MNYIIKKVLNSSVVLVHDTKDNEFILLGKGIGYGKKQENIFVVPMIIKCLSLLKIQNQNNF